MICLEKYDVLCYSPAPYMTWIRHQLCHNYLVINVFIELSTPVDNGVDNSSYQQYVHAIFW